MNQGLSIPPNSSYLSSTRIEEMGKKPYISSFQNDPWSFRISQIAPITTNIAISLYATKKTHNP
jgi:hypothetical protein